MAASQVAIVNRALIKLGVREINSIDDEVKQARICKSQWPLTRDMVLRKATWNFSIKRALLAEDTDTPLTGYKHQFPLPSDCLRPMQVSQYVPNIGLNLALNTFDAELYRIEGRHILINQTGPLQLRYVARVDDTTLWDPSFDEAMAARLAYDTAEALTQSQSKRQDAAKDYTAAIREAMTLDAIEEPPDVLEDDTWWISRFT